MKSVKHVIKKMLNMSTKRFILVFVYVLSSYLFMDLLVYGIIYLITGEHDPAKWYFLGRIVYMLYCIFLVIVHSYLLVRLMNNNIENKSDFIQRILERYDP